MAVVKRTLPSAPAPQKSSVVVANAPAFVLPTGPSVPSTDMGDYSILLFGEKKIGKTSLAAQFPDALLLMLEPGAKALVVHQVPILTWDQLKQAVKVLVPNRRYKTIVIDTVDLAYMMCERAVCARLSINHPSDEEWGKGWAAVRDEFTQWAQAMTNMGKGVIFISHAVEREIKTRGGVKYDRFQPTLTGAARNIVEGMVDMWMFYTYDDKRRVLTIRGDEHVMAGHRMQENFRWGSEDIRTIRMDPSPERGYAALVGAFQNRYNPTTHEVATVAPRAKGKK